VAGAPDHADQRKPPVAAHPEHRAFLEGELVKFLFEKDAEKPAGFTPEA
jgi:Fe-S cluster biosynthesis and repair protein YggX